MACKHRKTSHTRGKNGGEYVTCDNCTVVVEIIRVGPELCGQPLPEFGVTCTFPKGHELSTDAVEQLHGVRGGR